MHLFKFPMKIIPKYIKVDSSELILCYYYVKGDFNNSEPCHPYSNSGARFTKHLKPKIFLSAIQFVWHLRKS